MIQGLLRPIAVCFLLVSTTLFVVPAAYSLDGPVPKLLLVDAESGKDVGAIEDGAVLNVATMPSRKLTIRLNTDAASAAGIKNVTFGYDTIKKYRVENAPPYSLAGKTVHGFNSWTPSPGNHRISVIIRRNNQSEKNVDETYALNFSVINDLHDAKFQMKMPEGSGRSTVVPNSEVVTGPGSLHANVEQTATERIFLPTFRINVGGKAFVDEKGNYWQSDEALSEEQPFGITSYIDETLGNPVYQSGRRFLGDGAAYSIPLPTGVYSLTFHFMPPFQTPAGQLNFDVLVDGATVIEKLDPIAEVGSGKQLVKSVQVTSSSPNLQISFKVHRGAAVLNGFEIRPVLPPQEK